MTDLARLGEGVRRATEALLRGTGGGSVLLRVPRPGVTNSLAEQLGMAMATFDEVQLAPCVLRPMESLAKTEGERYELLIAARTAAAGAGGAAPELVLAWFAMAAGVVVEDELLRIASVSFREISGVPYVYRLEVVGPTAAVI